MAVVAHLARRRQGHAGDRACCGRCATSRTPPSSPCSARSDARAAKRSWRAARALAPGKWQHETELAVVNACRAAGARGVSFWPWTMSGPNADFTSLWNSFVAYDHVDREMKAGEVVRVDVGCQVRPLHGRRRPHRARLRHVHATDSARPGTCSSPAIARGSPSIKDRASPKAGVRRRARRSAPAGAVAHDAAGQARGRDAAGPKGTEPWQLHGVGLDDAEGLPEVLREGMVVAYELMFTVDGDGFYLEDMIAVKNDGYEILTPGLPYTAREVEAAMVRR